MDSRSAGPCCAPGDMISIGRHEFLFDGQRLHEFEDTGPVSLVADDLTVPSRRRG